MFTVYYGSDGRLDQIDFEAIGNRTGHDFTDTVIDVASAAIFENIWFVLPQLGADLYVGKPVLPRTSDEMVHRLKAELLPAMRNSPKWKSYLQEHDTSEREFERLLTSINQTSDVLIRGTVVRDGLEFIHASGDASFDLKIAEGSFRTQTNMEILIDPFTGLVRVAEMVSKGTMNIPGAGKYEKIPIFMRLQTETLTHKRVAPSLYKGKARPQVQPQGPSSIAAIYEGALPAIFTVIAENSQGSAFAISPYLLVTNAHVVGDARYVEVRRLGGAAFQAEVLSVFGGEIDLAFLVTDEVAAQNPLQLARDLPQIGSQALLIGSPIGLEGTLTGGLVSQYRRIQGATFVQINADMNPGSSGGPLLNMAGEVIGVATLYSNPKKGVVGLNFAIAATEIERHMPTSARALFVTQ